MMLLHLQLFKSLLLHWCSVWPCMQSRRDISLAQSMKNVIWVIGVPIEARPVYSLPIPLVSCADPFLLNKTKIIPLLFPCMCLRIVNLLLGKELFEIWGIIIRAGDLWASRCCWTTVPMILGHWSFWLWMLGVDVPQDLEGHRLPTPVLSSVSNAEHCFLQVQIHVDRSSLLYGSKS